MIKKQLTAAKVYLLLLLYITFVLFVISPDSYTHDLYGRSDSAWFFMCGKAWMNGMVPYVDFSDSKGPLLWLIYGIGYLLSPYNYTGVFWLSCLSYSLALFFGYRTALLLLGDERKSLFVALAMILPYFLYWCHYEIRAEDFCQPFISGALYFLVQSALAPSRKRLVYGGIFIGVGIAACLLIKWSIAVMYLSFGASLCVIAFRQHHCFTALGSIAAGTIVLLLPFVACFLHLGNFSAFIQEYFVNTTKSVSLSLMDTLIVYAKEWGLTLSCYKLVYLLYAWVIYLFYKQHHRLTCLPVLCCLFFLSLSIRNDLLYYTTVMAPFAIFALAYFVPRLHGCYGGLFVLIILAFQARNLDQKPNLFFQQEERGEYYAAAYVMSQKHQPTLINEGHEVGISTPAGALPGTRYWARQNGETSAMRQSRQKDIRQGKADFVTCYFHPQRDRQTAFYELLQQGGYVYYASFPYRGDRLYLYGKPGYRLPDDGWAVSNEDVLLKRQLFR